MHRRTEQAVGWGRRARALGASLVCVWFAACGTTSDKTEIKAAHAELQSLADGAFKQGRALPSDEGSDQAWWQQMAQQDLSKWVQAALANNRDLKAALARVAQAQAQAGMASAGRWPSFNASASSGRTTGEGQAMRTLGTSSGSTRDQLALQMNYEFDFWGRRGFSIESALQQIRSAEYGVASFQMSLTAEVAASYFRALALQERYDIVQNMLLLVKKNSDDIRRKMALGEATQVQLSQQLIFEQSLLAQAQDVLLQRDQALHQLALLAGVRPAQVQLAPAQLTHTRLPMPSLGLPANLLCRRPDLRQAQANLQAAQADVALARTLMLPSISLGLVSGWVSPGLRALTSGESGFVQSSLQASQAIFDGGARKQGVALSQARRDELIERYASAILAALRDTENALSGVEKSAEKLKWLQANGLQARQLARLMQDMLEKGGVDFVQMIQMQTAVYSAEDAAVSGLLDRILSQIELYKALGGSAVATPGDCQSTGERP